MTTYAGLYGPEALIDSSGHPITSATIDVFTHGTTTHVSLYQDNARVTPLSNPVPNGVDGSTAGRGLDTFGNLSFYVNPGVYDLRIVTGAGTRTVEIEVETDPAESAASGAVPVTTVATAGASQTVTFPTHGGAAFDLTGSAASCTLALTGGTAGEECTVSLYLRQGAAGSRAWTFPAKVHWPSAITPTFSTAANAYDLVVLSTIDGGVTVEATLVGSGLITPITAGAPSSLAVSAGDTSATLTWTQGAANGATVTQNEIWRSTTTGTETLLTTISAATSYNDTGLTNGTTYFYKVKAINSVGTSGFSNEASGTPSVAHYLSLPGTSGADATTPSAAANDINSGTASSDVGSFVIRARVALTAWVPATSQAIVAKWGAATASQQYLFYVDNAGKLNLAWVDSLFRSATSTVATGLANGSTKWIKVNFDTGGNGGTCHVSFWMSDDDVTYTQLGTTVDVAANAAHSTTAVLAVGADSTGANFTAGKVFRAKVLKGVTTPVSVVDVNFASQTPGSTSFAGVTGETWTVNGTASIV